MWKNVHTVYGAGIQPTTLEHESLPITTRQGLPPYIALFNRRNSHQYLIPHFRLISSQWQKYFVCGYEKGCLFVNKCQVESFVQCCANKCNRNVGIRYWRSFNCVEKTKMTLEVPPENINLRGIITVWLTSCLFCLDSAAFLMLSQLYLFSQIQTSQTVGQLNSDTSTYGECSLVPHKTVSRLDNV